MKRLVAAAVFLTLVIPVLAACAGGGGEPQNLAFDMEIRDGALVGQTEALAAKQGDTVTLRWTTDEPATVHLHGYDIERDVVPDMPTEYTFIADATGKFDITLHSRGAGGHTHGEGELCKATIPEGAPVPVVRVAAASADEPGYADVRVDLKDFVLAEGGGHWHVAVDGVPVGMFYVPEATVAVGPGEHEIAVTLSDANHCEYDIGATTTVVVEGTPAGAAEDGHDHGEEDEAVLTSLEVYPR